MTAQDIADRLIGLKGWSMTPERVRKAQRLAERSGVPWADVQTIVDKRGQSAESDPVRVELEVQPGTAGFDAFFSEPEPASSGPVEAPPAPPVDALPFPTVTVAAVYEPGPKPKRARVVAKPKTRKRVTK